MGIMVLALIVSPAKAVPDCHSLLALIDPCQPFLCPPYPPVPSIECCAGAQEVASIVLSSKENIKVACKCFQEAGRRKPVPAGRVTAVLQDCNIHVNMTMGPDVDCSKYVFFSLSCKKDLLISFRLWYE